MINKFICLPVLFLKHNRVSHRSDFPYNSTDLSRLVRESSSNLVGLTLSFMLIGYSNVLQTLTDEKHRRCGIANYLIALLDYCQLKLARLPVISVEVNLGNCSKGKSYMCFPDCIRPICASIYVSQ